MSLKIIQGRVFIMNSKVKGFLKLALSLAVIAVLVFSAVVGFGKSKLFSASRIKQGLDLAGGVSITYEAVGEDVSEEDISDAKYKLQ